MRELTQRQREVYDYIVSYSEENGYPPTLQEIARCLGISGNLGVIRHLSALEKKGYIRRHPGSSRGISLLLDEAETVSLPLVGRIRAGALHPAIEDIRGRLTLDASLVGAKDAFLLEVEGDSMIEAQIAPKDLVIVKPQSTAENGEIVVAMVDGEATLKRFFREKGRIRLQPENREMDPIIIREGEGDLSIVGKVIGLLRTLP